MEEKKSFIKTKKQMYMVIGIFALVLFLGGITYAFFNYTRTGSANTIRVGKIAFTSDQNTPINLTNMFPIEPTAANLADNTKVGIVTIDISGDTTYNQGIEYLVTATNVQNTVGTGVNTKVVPISISVEYAASESKDIGTSSASYFGVRGGNNSYYKVLSNDTINDGDRLLVGYIKPDNTGIDGKITIKAYLDSSKIAISDTYNGTESDNMGTTTNWVNGRTVLTTTEWNALQENGVSFQVKVEANEGIWVKDQIIYNANGGTISPSYKEINNDANTYGLLDTPQRQGYTFDGWYSSAIGGTLVESSTAYISGTSPTMLYAHWSLAPICIRATSLHTEVCTQTSGYCAMDGYAENENITYGNLGTSGNMPITGDAFDCDVNGDGNYTERFYYVSDYYDTSTNTFDNTYATLIYYSNTVNGIANEGGTAYYATARENWHGPVTAKTNLPTTSQWTNITLKETDRFVLSCDNGNCTNTPVLTTGGGNNTIENPFSYSGYAARLLTIKELDSADCTNTLAYDNGLRTCNFLMEGTNYADSSKLTTGTWLDTPRTGSSIGVWSVYAPRSAVNYTTTDDTTRGTRPAIDIPYSRLGY